MSLVGDTEQFVADLEVHVAHMERVLEVDYSSIAAGKSFGSASGESSTPFPLPRPYGAPLQVDYSSIAATNSPGSASGGSSTWTREQVLEDFDKVEKEIKGARKRFKMDMCPS